MATGKDQYQPPSSESLAAGYEKSGVSVIGLAVFALCLIFVAAMIHAAVWFLFGAYLNSDRSRDQALSALTDPEYVARFNKANGTSMSPRTVPLPPPPRIQPTAGLPPNTPDADLQQMYVGEDAVFRQMGWEIDPVSHVQRRIPDAVLAAVIADESKRQAQQPKAIGAPPPPAPTTKESHP